MISKIENNKESIQSICKKHKVSRLNIFGSAMNEKLFNKELSDIDLAVIFDPSIPIEDMADHYFGLIEDLERIFESEVDLVTLKSVKNKIFKKELENTMIQLYAA